ncbi:MAG: RyR domain-containing protein [Bacillota bacterium]
MSNKINTGHIREYKSIIDIYQRYGEALKLILNVASNNYAPLAIIQAREKSLSSFIEKLDKKNYEKPFEEMTDLCGARIITQTSSQVQDVCRFIESYFDIDVENSENVMLRLKENEFGYRSVHYIVTLAEKSEGILKEHGYTNEMISPIRNRKAEIQVRTILEHAWADISHDRIYKNDFKIPQEWKREIHRLSAVLENADKDFASIVDLMDEYKLTYNAYMSPEAREAEIESLKAIIGNLDSGNQDSFILKHKLRIAKLAKSLYKWDEIIDVLDMYKQCTDKLSSCSENYVQWANIFIELGNAYCMKHAANPEADDFLEGLNLISTITKEGRDLTGIDRKIKAKAYKHLGFIKLKVNPYKNSIGYFIKAYELNPENPYLLNYCIERPEKVNEIVRASILKAIDTCTIHIDSGLELPQAFFAIGRFYILLGDTDKCYIPYLQGINYCFKNYSSTNEQHNAALKQFFINEINFIEGINDADNIRIEHSSIVSLLHLGKAVIFGDKISINYLKKKRSKEYSSSWFKGKIVIAAGGAAKEVDADMKLYKDCLKEGFKDYKGTIISGGTKSGIPGVIGCITAELKNEKKADITLLGYSPEIDKELLNGVQLDFDNYIIIRNNDTRFCVGPAIQGWVDIISAIYDGNDTLSKKKEMLAKKVTILGINGGNISAIEYRIALSLGVKLGVIKDSGRAAKQIADDKIYGKDSNLIIIPKDAMAIRAFIRDYSPRLDEDEIEKLAKENHQMYLKCEHNYNLSWDMLNQSFKDSNKCKVIYFEDILNSLGYEISRKKDGVDAVKLNNEEICLMAEMEHGRYCIERLLDGWKYGKIKDAKSKISNFLTEWDKLTDEEKHKNILGIFHLLDILEENNYFIYKK